MIPAATTYCNWQLCVYYVSGSVTYSFASCQLLHAHGAGLLLISGVEEVTLVLVIGEHRSNDEQLDTTAF